MTISTIEITEKTSKHFSLTNLEKFINSEDFEDLVLGYQMLKGQTNNIQSFSSFKNELGL
ncbi:MAG: hypothetical protein PHE25_01760 [Candidatus Gracilibacteria bacterium]|nr:hypothetical protein [Candidatus Gracilibacteria bacterium]